MFIDEVTFKIIAGTGGGGKTSFFPRRGSPNGGNGGRGGNVYAQVNTQLSNLNKYSNLSSLVADNGMPGASNRRHGARGQDLFIDLPIGTTIIDLDTHEEIELKDKYTTLLICKGGAGGLGNDALKTSINRGSKKAQPGEKGQVKNIEIILKLIADYGLIGLPNTGKSTLLNSLTSAQAKVANYPFTTLEPNLGVLGKKVIADIPGLIEGASEGRGLGIKFLKHIEKVSLLVHCISTESTDVMRDYKIVMDQLSKYNPHLAKKDSIVLLTKSDLASEREVLQKVKQLKKVSKHVYPISILDQKSIKTIRDILSS